MKHKPSRIVLTAMLVLLFVVSAGSSQTAVRLASWNLKHLGWNNDKDLEAVAQVIQRFDLVALQEVMKSAAAKDLAARVSQRSDEPWSAVVSHTIGDNSYKESYALLWRDGFYPASADGLERFENFRS